MVTDSSLTALPLHLQRQYVYLRIYSFIWWGCFALFLIFQPLYLVRIGFPIWAIFTNGALDAFLSLCFQSYWSNRSDREHKIKRYMILGNFFLASACFLILFVNTIWALFLLTFIIRSGPFSDIYATVYAYKISEHCVVPTANPIDQKFHNINIFAQYRKYGSVGWAAIAPLGGLLINKFDFGLNFILGGIGFIFMSAFAAVYLKEEDVIKQDTFQLKTTPNNHISQKLSILDSFRKILLNKFFVAFMIATLLFSLATTMTYQTQGIFYGLFAPNDYFIVALTFSLAAFIEWPLMTMVAKRVKKIGWERVVILAYLLSAIRLGLSPLLILFNGNIWGAFLLQILAGIIFGIRLPAATFGVYVILEKEQRTFGQSLNVSMQHVGSFLGSLIGAIVAFIIQDNVSNTFLAIYWIAAIFALISSIWFYLQITRKFRNAGVSS